MVNKIEFFISAWSLRLVRISHDVFSCSVHYLLCLSNASAGSDVVSMKCKADRVDGGYIINGNKMWCTNGPVAQTLVFSC